jgi:membrane fusion protein (multidrug efflux system)
MATKRKTGLFIFIIAIVLILAAAFCLYKHKSSVQKPQRPPTPPVTLVALKKHPIPLIVSTYGYTLSPHSVTVRATAGGTIQSIHFQSGQKVKKGQLLFVIQASDVTQQLNYLKPQLIEAKANYLRNYSVNQQTPGAVARQTLLTLKATYQQYLTQYQELYNQSHIKAAIDGRISDTNLAAGDLISPNDTLATISTKDLLQLSYHLPSQWARQAKVGQSVSFINNQEEKYQGKVSYVSPILNLNNQGVNLRANVINAKHLTANQFGQIIQVINPKQELLAVSQTLAQTDAKGYFVLGVKNNKVVNNYFTPGFVTKDGFITITSGLRTNDKIINNPSVYSVGQKVEVAK